VRLAILHPGVASRDCGHCEAWLYDDRTGRPIERGGNMVPRPRGTAPCRLRANGCPKGAPEKQNSLTEANAKAYRHYQECRAVNQWPDDATVRKNAAIIRAAEQIARDAIDIDRLGPIAGLLNRG